MAGTGETVISVSPAAIWAALQDPLVLAAIIPGSKSIERLDEGRFRAVLALGVGPFRSDYTVELVIAGLDMPHSLTLAGHSVGGLGSGEARGHVALHERRPGRTEVSWRFAGTVSGPVGVVGDTVLAGVSRLFVTRFFAALKRVLTPV